VLSNWPYASCTSLEESRLQIATSYIGIRRNWF
jgi:ATP phosphoribosyltransferase